MANSNFPIFKVCFVLSFNFNLNTRLILLGLGLIDSLPVNELYFINFQV